MSRQKPLSIEHQRVHRICMEFLGVLGFIASDTGRDPKFVDNHLLYYVFQDLLQSTVAIHLLATEGMLSAGRRELRFILEAAIKVAYVQQAEYASSAAEKLKTFKKNLDSPSISLKKDVQMSMLGESARESFLEESGRVYGVTSNYVHLSAQQILAQIDAVNRGNTAGYESPEEVVALGDLLERGFACSLVFVLHSVPEHVAGDWLVEPDGSTVNSYFTKSRWIAAIDEHFDYKHERQAQLGEIVAARAKRVAF